MTRSNWQIPPADIQMERHQADIWRVAPTVPADSVPLFESALSADESQRAARFHFDTDRLRFITAYTSLRRILARYLQCDPRDLNFSANAYGKPFLPDHEIDFNLSHSGEYALIAVTRGRKIGVDVEFIRDDIELESLAARHFSPREVSELLALPLKQRVVGFFNCWTRKEAYIKAQGLGLSLPLDSFDVSLGEPARLRGTRPDAKEASRWSLHSLDVGSNYAAALAVEGDGFEIRCWDGNINR
ncbi:MAG: 4'-phosphopantetheinyl transferase superfamily protein [Chloroflexota bacterium]